MRFMLDGLRTRLHEALVSPRGDAFTAIRVPKDLARRLNVAFGRPVCDPEELASRRAARAKLTELRALRVAAQLAPTPEGGATSEGTARVKEPVPVIVYFEKNRNDRELGKITATLDLRKIPYRALDVAGDESTMAFVTRTAGCHDDELPIVFVGTKPIGNARALIEADVSGELAKAVFGPS
jgi:hypothetical protein